MIFDTEQTLATRYQLNWWSTGEESNQNLGQDLLTEKNPGGRPKTTWPSVAVNDINSCSEVRASSNYLMRNNKITAEEQDTDKRGKHYLEKKTYGQK